MILLISFFFIKDFENFRSHAQVCLFYDLSFWITSKYLIKPSSNVLIVLLVNYAIMMRIILSRNIQPQRKSKKRWSNSKLSSYLILMMFRMPWNFQQQRVFLSRDTEFCKKVRLGQVFAKCGKFLMSTSKHLIFVRISESAEDYENYFRGKLRAGITNFRFLYVTGYIS